MLEKQLKKDDDEKDDEEEDHDAHEHKANKIELKESSSLAAVFMNDDDVEKPVYNVEEFYHKKGICQEIARSSHFANFTVFVVIFNAIYIGVDSDHNDAQNIYDADFAFQACSQFFCFYFTFEVVVRFLAFEHKHDCLKDGWFKFDAFLVVTMIMDTWMLMPALKLVSGDGGVKIPTQPLRMLRLFKLSRMARLMKAFPELVTMIKGLFRSLRAIASSGLLVGLMVYTWAILLHMLMKDEDEFNEGMQDELGLDFKTITNCMWALIMDGTLMLDGTPTLMTTLLFAGKLNFVLAGIFFLLFSLLSALLILQMLIGVLCDVVSRVGQEQRDAQAVGLVKQEILGELQKFETGDGKIGQRQLLKVMKHPQCKALMKKLNINRLFMMELQRMMFPTERSQVPLKAILDLMILCRGDNQATVEALAGGCCFLNQELAEVKKYLVEQQQNFQQTFETFVDGFQTSQVQVLPEKSTFGPQSPRSGPQSPRSEHETHVLFQPQPTPIMQMTSSSLRLQTTPREGDGLPTTPASPASPLSVDAHGFPPSYQQIIAGSQPQTLPSAYQPSVDPQRYPRYPLSYSTYLTPGGQTAV
jgi:hypothetical protein